jgi:DNA-binding NtrC family response regulator
MPVVAVIDDEPMICDLVEDCLRHTGSEVYSAPSAQAGVTLLASRYFDLALIDVLLQDTSGILLAEIAANQNTPVVLITGHADTALRLKQFDFPHILKPFNVAQLNEAVAQVIADRHGNIQRLTDGLARMHANLAGLDMETANTGGLIAKPRAILARTGKDTPKFDTPGPAR